MTKLIERTLVKDISLTETVYEVYKKGDLLHKQPNHEYEKLVVSLSYDEWKLQLSDGDLTTLPKLWAREKKIQDKELSPIRLKAEKDKLHSALRRIEEEHNK